MILRWLFSRMVSEANRKPGLAARFPNDYSVFPGDSGRYFICGDNTVNSLDSRAWGRFPREKVIGRCFFVFWPITERSGWGVR